jgi:PKHD-type hydroxylase
MFLVISDMLSAAELEAMHLLIASIDDSFQSGAATAGHHARGVKNNEQAGKDQAAPLLRKVDTTLLNNPVFKAAARPKVIIKSLLSRYKPGMHYGLHVDDPLMAGIRTDLSFTLFLSEPESYSGGALVVEDNTGERSFKLKAGSLILYPTTTLHRVEAVTAGERVAVVGWVRSFLRSGEQREIVFDLENIIASLQGADRAVLDQLYKVRANLLRLWVED